MGIRALGSNTCLAQPDMTYATPPPGNTPTVTHVNGI